MIILACDSMEIRDESPELLWWISVWIADGLNSVNCSVYAYFWVYGILDFFLFYNNNVIINVIINKNKNKNRIYVLHILL